MLEIEGGYTLEYVEEGLLVEAPEVFGSSLAEEHLGCFHGLFVLLLAVDHDGDFLGKELLKNAASGVLGVLCDGGFDRLAVEHGEDLDVALGVGIAYVEPELVELVRARACGVEPDIALFGLSELAAVGFGDERGGEGVGFLAEHAADELRAGGDVAPLVGASELEPDVLMLEQIEEVVALKELVGEFRERHSFG